ncbi:TonB-dependent siderophore receptor [Sphingomonas sp. 8AM]|uniref:TonB-dependent siderophore receptor n=1 Tax=Sphingomonas sp. 8AM TaxID=2653170 RepID=UPI0012F2D3C2|nr:TonB-dependent receptor [Sphingomonas sp. 8AM]VXD01673.1 conserved exported hypothetical protein [Sphingomonas sp. 8AM]
MLAMLRARSAKALLCSVSFVSAGSLSPAVATAQQNDAGPGDDIVVTADRQDSFGADYVQAGTFRDARLIETPLTVAVMTKQLLDAQQARSINDAVRNTAGVSQAQINTSIYSNLAVRGITLNNFTNVRWNGVLPVVNLVEQPIESKDRIEVLKGAAGLYYGFATPSGIVNLVTERPTGAAVTRSEWQADANGSAGMNVDVGRRFANAGVRVNAGTGILKTGVRRTEGTRSFVTGAFDWKLAGRVQLLLDAEYIDRTISEPAEFSLTPVNGTITLPPLRSSRTNLGADWMQARGRETNLLARMNVDVAPGWRIAAAVGRSYLTRNRAYSSFGRFDPETGNGTLTVAQTTGNDYTNAVYRGDLSGTVRTGPVEHNLLIGIAFQTRDGNVPTAVRRTFAQNLYDPVAIPYQPSPPRIIPSPTRTEDLGIYGFDRASVGDWLQATVGWRKTRYTDVSRTSLYKVTPDTFSYGLMVRPVRWISAYANYIEGLEPGPIAQQIANNAGEILPAAVSRQKEAGVKVEPLAGILLTGTWFHIARPSAYLNSANVFVQDGEATYEGAEFSAMGEIGRHLSITASAMTLSARQRTGAATVVGKRIENAAPFSGSIFAEYRLPSLSGLSVSAGVFRVAQRAVNALNQGFAPGYTTVDVGMAYRFALLGKGATVHAYGDNVTDRRHWAATGSSLLAQGLPRTVRLSLALDL